MGERRKREKEGGREGDRLGGLLYFHLLKQKKNPKTKEENT